MNSDTTKKKKEETDVKKASDTSVSEALLDRLLNAPEYTYDMNADPIYAQYRELYENEGKNAAEDVFGLASSLTGGYANSYAATVAEKAYDTYLDRLAEKAGELEEKAYERNRDETEGLYKQLAAATDMEDRRYSREREEKADTFGTAVKEAEMGDYSALDALGVDTSAMKDRDARETAEFFAKYLDYSKLKKLGVKTDKLSEKDLLEIAKVFASYGDYTLLARLGANTAAQKEKDKLENQLLRARYYNYYN